MLNLFGSKKKQEINVPTQKGMTIRDMIAPAPVFEEHPKHLRLGDNFAKTYVVTDFPRKPKGNFLSKLYRFNGNLTISTHLVPKPNEKFMKQTERSITEINTILNNPKKINGIKPGRLIDLEHSKKAARDTLEKMKSGDQENIFHVHMYLHLQAESMEKMERLEKRLKAICRQRKLKIAQAEDNMVLAFKSVLPIVENNLPELTYRAMDSEAASSLFPYDEAQLFHTRGYIKGKNLTTKSLVLVDQKAMPSHNEFIVGQTGMGKTFYLIKDMLRKWMGGDRVFVIDPEGEISRIVAKVGGQVIKLSPTTRYIVNILEIRPQMDRANIAHNYDEGEEEEIIPHLFQKIQRLKIFFKLIKKQFSMVEQAQLEKALLAIYEKKGITFDTDFSKVKSEDFPILTDLFDEIADKEQYEHLQEFKEILFMYVHGSNSRMFNGHTNVDMDNDFVCFNLKDLEEESDSQAAAMYNALSFLWDEITSGNQQFTWLYADECHTLADPDNPRAMKFLYQIYKRIRKYKGGAVVATQQIADFRSAVEGHRNYGDAIIGNSYSQLILPLKERDIADLRNQEILKLSEEEELIISKFKQGQGIYVVGNDRVHMEVDHTPEELELINPKAYAEKYGDMKVSGY